MSETPLRSRVPEIASPLLEQAAARSRLSLRTRVHRVRLAWRSVLQAGLAAAGAWLIAVHVFGHPRPFFAPVAAVITLGLTFAARGRRAAELAIGVALGIAVGDLIVLGIGIGAWQLALVVMLAIVVALLVGKGQLLVNQAAVSAALVATLQPPTNGLSFARFLDALVGGGMALLVSGLIVPANPQHMVRRAAWPLLDELAATLGDVAAALMARDLGKASAALDRARSIDPLTAQFVQAVEISRETARFAPQRRHARALVETYGDAAGQIDLAVRNVRVLARGAVRAIRLDENVPDDVADSLRDLAEAVRALDGALDEDGRGDRVRGPALRAAARATLVLERTGNLSVSVIVGQVRSTATDLLSTTGMDPDEAAAAVRAATSAEARRELADEGS